MQQGYDEPTASKYAVLIGDTPCMDAAGNIVVIEGGHPIAKLRPLDFFEDPDRSKTSSFNKAKDLIRALIRQADSDIMPKNFVSTPAIRALVDDVTAQALYNDILTEIEASSGIKFVRNSQLPPKTNFPDQC